MVAHLKCAHFQFKVNELTALLSRESHLSVCEKIYSNVQVTDGIYKSDGYGLGRSVVIEGDEGLIMIDTSESITAATNLLQDLRNFTKKPIKAIVYTHFHGDHIQGAQVSGLYFVELTVHLTITICNYRAMLIYLFLLINLLVLNKERSVFVA